MTDETIGLISVIKGWGGHRDWNLDERIAEFLRKSRGTNYRYSREDIVQEMRRALVDYMSTCDDVMAEIRRYFLMRDWWEDRSEWDKLRCFLGGIQVRGENHLFINNFRDIPMWHEEDDTEC